MSAARNNLKSNNFMTLGAHVATRLPRVHYFTSTDVELTTNAVILLRVFFQQLSMSAAAAAGVEQPGAAGPNSAATAAANGTAGRASELAAHLAGPPNPGKTPNGEVDGITFDGVVAALLDFLAAPHAITESLYELHVQVRGCVLVGVWDGAAS